MDNMFGINWLERARQINPNPIAWLVLIHHALFILSVMIAAYTGWYDLTFTTETILFLAYLVIFGCCTQQNNPGLVGLNWNIHGPQNPCQNLLYNVNQVQMRLFSRHLVTSMFSLRNLIIEAILSGSLLFIMMILLWVHRFFHPNGWVHAWWRTANHAVTIFFFVFSQYVIYQIGLYLKLSRGFTQYTEAHVHQPTSDLELLTGTNATVRQPLFAQFVGPYPSANSSIAEPLAFR